MDFSNYLKLINNCDENAPLLSDTSFGQCLSFVPLRQVPPSDLIQMSQSLNVEQLIRTQDGLARDYRGLAELLGFTTTQLEAHFKRSNNPTKCLLDSFMDTKNLTSSSSSSSSSSNSSVFSVTDLIKLIEKLERFDVLDDLLPILVRIANESQSQPTKANIINRQQAAVESNGNLEAGHHSDESIRQSPNNNTLSGHSVPATAVQQFDAFVCYAPEDYDYAVNLISILERNNKRIITPDNILAGQLKYNALVQMIAEECKRVILILTPNFLRSKDCDFQAKFAYEIAIQSAQFPKVIPILYEPVDEAQLPCLLRVISKIDMTHRNASQHQWQLRKVLGSLNQANDTTDKQHHNSVTYYEESRSMNAITHGDRPLKITLNRSQTTINESTAAISQPLDHSTTSSSSEHHNVNYRADNLLSPEPIVDLALSQSSRSELSIASTSISMCSPTTTSSFLLSTELPLMTTPPTPPPPTPSNLVRSSSSQNPLINLYRSFKRKVSGTSERAISPSMSSRANLLWSPDSLSR